MDREMNRTEWKTLPGDLKSSWCCHCCSLSVFQDWSCGIANKQLHSEDLWTHRGALIEKSLALSHPSITCIPNPWLPPSSLTSNLICCLYFPQRQLPFLRHAQMSLSPTLLLLAMLSQQQQCMCSLNLQLKPARRAGTTQCNLWLILSPRLLSPVSTVIVWGI